MHPGAVFSTGDAGLYVAIIGIILTVIGMLAGLVVMAVKVSHRFGRHDERLVQAERDIKTLKEADRNADLDRQQLAVMRALMERVETGLRDMGTGLNRRMDGIEADIRRFLTGHRED